MPNYFQTNSALYIRFTY